MKVAKISNYNEDDKSKAVYDKFVDIDLKNIFLALQGRIRFGTGVSGARGENIEGEFRQFTSSNTAGSNNLVPHSLSATPIGWIVVNQNWGGVLYTGTNTFSSSTVTFISTTTNTTYTIFLLK